MYGDYWQLARLPFENSCDPLFFFRGRSHEAALLKLQYVVEQSKGVALLVGEHGTGKTCITRALEAELQAAADGDPSVQCAPLVRLMFPRMSADEVLRYLVEGLSEPASPLPSAGDALVRRLEAALREHAQSGRRPALMIDDAHLIESADVLQMLAQVLSLCEAQRLPLSLMLLGQPELIRQVQRVPALGSRVAVRAALQPFEPGETSAYIRHRLQVAGLDGCMFDAKALAAFHRLSQGYPRRINQLCDLALLVGYVDELSSLSSGEAEAAAEELLSVTTD
jgi:type II secretory pathway predicted ATPase ExeA